MSAEACARPPYVFHLCLFNQNDIIYSPEAHTLDLSNLFCLIWLQNLLENLIE